MRHGRPRRPFERRRRGSGSQGRPARSRAAAAASSAPNLVRPERRPVAAPIVSIDGRQERLGAVLPLPGRLLSAGARGAERTARATGIEQAIEDGIEAAVIRALESPATERAMARALDSPAIERGDRASAGEPGRGERRGQGARLASCSTAPGSACSPARRRSSWSSGSPRRPRCARRSPPKGSGCSRTSAARSPRWFAQGRRDPGAHLSASAAPAAAHRAGPERGSGQPRHRLRRRRRDPQRHLPRDRGRAQPRGRSASSATASPLPWWRSGPSPGSPSGAFYLVGFWSLSGQTPGMRFLGLRLDSRSDGGSAGAGRCAVSPAPCFRRSRSASGSCGCSATTSAAASAIAGPGPRCPIRRRVTRGGAGTGVCVGSLPPGATVIWSTVRRAVIADAAAAPGLALCSWPSPRRGTARRLRLDRAVRLRPFRRPRDRGARRRRRARRDRHQGHRRPRHRRRRQPGRGPAGDRERRRRDRRRRPFQAVFRGAVTDVHRAIFDRDRDTVTLTLVDVGTVLRGALQAVKPSVAKKIPAGPTSRSSRSTRPRGCPACCEWPTRSAPALRLAARRWRCAASRRSGSRRDRRRRRFASRSPWSCSGCSGRSRWVRQRRLLTRGVDDPGKPATRPGRSGRLPRRSDERLYMFAGAGAVIAAAASSLLRPVEIDEPLRRLASVTAMGPRATAGGARAAWRLSSSGSRSSIEHEAVLRPVTSSASSSPTSGCSSCCGCARPEAAEAKPSDRRKPGATDAGAVAIGVIVDRGGGLQRRGGQRGAGTAPIGRGLQRSDELCDRPLDQVAFPATHNSMSAATNPGWLFAQQERGIPDQMNDGVRGLLIDAHYGIPTKSGRSRPISRREGARASGDARGARPGRDRVGAADPRPHRQLAPRPARRQVYFCHALLRARRPAGRQGLRARSATSSRPTRGRS